MNIFYKKIDTTKTEDFLTIKPEDIISVKTSLKHIISQYENPIYATTMITYKETSTDSNGVQTNVEKTIILPKQTARDYYLRSATPLKFQGEVFNEITKKMEPKVFELNNKFSHPEQGDNMIYIPFLKEYMATLPHEDKGENKNFAEAKLVIDNPIPTVPLTFYAPKSFITSNLYYFEERMTKDEGIVNLLNTKYGKLLSELNELNDPKKNLDKTVRVIEDNKSKIYEKLEKDIVITNESELTREDGQTETRHYKFLVKFNRDTQKFDFRVERERDQEDNNGKKVILPVVEFDFLYSNKPNATVKVNGAGLLLDDKIISYDVFARNQFTLRTKKSKVVSAKNNFKLN